MSTGKEQGRKWKVFSPSTEITDRMTRSQSMKEGHFFRHAARRYKPYNLRPRKSKQGWNFIIMQGSGAHVIGSWQGYINSSKYHNDVIILNSLRLLLLDQSVLL